jgi:hypothetical protein
MVGSYEHTERYLCFIKAGKLSMIIHLPAKLLLLNISHILNGIIKFLDLRM